jgi:capsular polysaccharide biosynthesis protein
MELRDLLKRLWHWSWLLLLGALLGLAGGYGLSRLQTPEYEATTTILLVRPAQDSLSELSYLNDQQLAQTYGQLLLTRPVVAAAEAQLGAPMDVQRVSLEFVSDTQLMRLTVRDPDPQRAADIANTLVRAFTAQNDSLQGV